MKIFDGLFLFSFVLVFSGCVSPVKLDPDANSVEVVDYIKPEIRDKLTEVDQVKCQLGENARTRDANIEGCKNTLRNQAAKIGGRLVLIKSGEPERYELSAFHGRQSKMRKLCNHEWYCL
ncbi:MAG: hypothetical protein ACOYOK_14225 [Pseudobdellovibrionaceae bacterium]